MAKGKKIKVTLIKSPIHKSVAHKATVKGLGLRRMRHSVEVRGYPCN